MADGDKRRLRQRQGPAVSHTHAHVRVSTHGRRHACEIGGARLLVSLVWERQMRRQMCSMDHDNCEREGGLCVGAVGVCESVCVCVCVCWCVFECVCVCGRMCVHGGRHTRLRVGCCRPSCFHSCSVLQCVVLCCTLQQTATRH